MNLTFRNILFFAVFYIFFSGSMYSQNKGSAETRIKINVRKAISIQLIPNIFQKLNPKPESTLYSNVNREIMVSYGFGKSRQNKNNDDYILLNGEKNEQIKLKEGESLSFASPRKLYLFPSKFSKSTQSFNNSPITIIY